MNKAVRYLLMTAVMLVSLSCLHSEVSAKDADGDIVIVIDPGHGEDDPGSIATTGAYEKDCNYAIATAMKNELEKYEGVKVYFTRSEDTWMTNTGRAMVAKALNADFLISLHNNSGSESNTGALAYRSVNANYSEATNDMCALILDNLSNLGLANGGVQTRTDETNTYEDYYTLIAEGVRAGIPSIIVEHCFLSNPTDAAFISNTDGSLNETNLEAMGVADANAVVSYFSLEKRTAEADSKTTMTLQKGYSVEVQVPDAGSEEVSWYSIDKSIATVDSNGVATAVSSGTTNIVYQIGDKTTGYCTLQVEEATPLYLVGGLDPTFYYTENEFNAIKVDEAFAFVLYSDGSAKKVTPDTVGTVDLTKVGIQDIPITYEDLSGTLRICFSSADYLPEVTLPAETESTATETTTVTDTTSVTQTESGDSGESSSLSTLGSVLKYIIVLVVVIIIGTGLFIYETSRKRRRRRGRRRHS